MSNVGKISQVLNAYPVGSIYMSVNSTNPGELFGGTWEQIQGRFLLEQGSVVILRVQLAEKRIMRYLIAKCQATDTGLLLQPMTTEKVQKLVLIVSIMGYRQMLVAIQKMTVMKIMDDIPSGLVAMAQGNLIEMSSRTIICNLISLYIWKRTA